MDETRLIPLDTNPNHGPVHHIPPAEPVDFLDTVPLAYDRSTESEGMSNA